MPNVIRRFQLAGCWTIIAVSWYLDAPSVAQNSANAASAGRLDSTVQSQAKQRADLDQVLSNRLHELFGTPSGEKPKFVWELSQNDKEVSHEASHVEWSNDGKRMATGDQAARKGDVAKGAIVLEEKDVLYLARPCQNEIVPFHKPYEKQRTGSTTCNGKPVDINLVTQQ